MKIGGVILTRTYNIIGILSCLISFIIMALPMIWYAASALWFFPGAIMILLLSLVIVFATLKQKSITFITTRIKYYYIAFQFAVVTFIT